MSPVVCVAQPPTRIICEGLFGRGWDLERSPHRSQMRTKICRFRLATATTLWQASRRQLAEWLYPYFWQLRRQVGKKQYFERAVKHGSTELGDLVLNQVKEGMRYDKAGHANRHCTFPTRQLRMYAGAGTGLGLSHHNRSTQHTAHGICRMPREAFFFFKSHRL